MLISVIMLTYNRKEYLDGMISDVLSQDYKDFEFIIVDNGSTDGSDMILRRYVAEDDRVRVITLKQPCSIGKARNLGAKESKGEYIAYVDDDDRLDKDFLSFMVELIKESDADIVMCGSDEFENGEIRPHSMYDEKIVLSGEEAVVELLKRKKIRAGMPTKMLRRNIILSVPFVEGCSAEDTNTVYKYYANAKKVVGYGISKYHFRRHTGNISGYTSNPNKMTRSILEEYLNLYQTRAAYLKQRFPNKTDFWDYSVWSFMLSMSKRVIDYRLEDCYEQLTSMKMELVKNKMEFLNSPHIQGFEVKWLEEVLKGESL